MTWIQTNDGYDTIVDLSKFSSIFIEDEADFTEFDPDDPLNQDTLAPREFSIKGFYVDGEIETIWRSSSREKIGIIFNRINAILGVKKLDDCLEDNSTAGG